MLLAHQHTWGEGRAATDEELLLCHTAEHVELIRLSALELADPALTQASSSTPPQSASAERGKNG